jgi:hypothetical protein
MVWVNLTSDYRVRTRSQRICIIKRRNQWHSKCLLEHYKMHFVLWKRAMCIDSHQQRSFTFYSTQSSAQSNPEVMATKPIVEATYSDNRPDPMNPGQFLPVNVPGAPITHFRMVITCVFGNVIHNRQMVQRGKHPSSRGIYRVESGGRNTWGQGPRGGYTGRGRGRGRGG